MGRRSRNRLVARLRRLRRDTGAVAAVEFALIVPFLLLLFLGSIEASSLITVDRRVNTIAGTMGDLVARWDTASNGAMTAGTLNDYFQAAQGIMFPYDTAQLEQVVTLIEVDEDDGTTEVRWSCGYNGGTKKTVGDPYPSLPPEMKTLVQGASGYVVASEIRYAYLPVLGLVFTETMTLSSESFYLPRFNKYITGPAAC